MIPAIDLQIVQKSICAGSEREKEREGMQKLWSSNNCFSKVEDMQAVRVLFFQPFSLWVQTSTLPLISGVMTLGKWHKRSVPYYRRLKMGIIVVPTSQGFCEDGQPRPELQKPLQHQGGSLPPAVTAARPPMPHHPWLFPLVLPTPLEALPSLPSLQLPLGVCHPLPAGILTQAKIASIS